MFQRIIRMLIGSALLIAVSSHAGPTLVKNGVSSYEIVLPPDAIAAEKYAAEELQNYLEKISGARLPIHTNPTANRRVILLGARADFAKLGFKFDPKELGTDGFALRTVGTRLVIAGGRPRGTLNGVYTFLEEQLGVRWFTPELELVRKTNSIHLPDLNEFKLPALETREVFWTEIMRDPDFAARHRLNGNSYRLGDKHGGRLAVYHPFVHSFDALIPPGLYTNHPEYFPLIKGKRTNGYVQRCLSNPDVLKLSIEKVRQWIRDNPQANIISVSQNDTFNYCECERCKSLDDAEGTPAASLLQYVNAIAAAVEKESPHVRIDTLAYQYTRKPPKTIRPHRNVIIRLCSIECCFAHPFDGCSSKANQRFVEDIKAWEPVAPLLYVWDYTPNFAHYQQPFPNFDAIQLNVKFFIKHNVRGLFEQGNYSSGGNGELGPLRAYLLAKLLWNPDTDLRRHVQEFTDSYYGQAAPEIREYVELLQRQVRGRDVHAHIFDAPTSAYLNHGFMIEADAILAKAEGAAADEETRFRVQVARLPIWYLQLIKEKTAPDQREPLLTKFMQVATKAGVSNISESRSLKDWGASMLGK